MVEDPTGGVVPLRDAIIQHLDTAATLIAKARPEQFKHAQWDLQMACEKVLKLLSERRHATYPETHDLYYLFDQMPGDAPFNRAWLHNIPNWKRMAEWRYGKGPRYLAGRCLFTLSVHAQDRPGDGPGRRSRHAYRRREHRDKPGTVPARGSRHVFAPDRGTGGDYGGQRLTVLVQR